MRIAVLGSIESQEKQKIANEIVEAFKTNFSDAEGEVYLGYPIYIDEIARRKTCVDIAIVSTIGVFIFNILTEKVTDYGEIQDDIYSKVETKFKKRKLIFDFNVLTFAAVDIEEQEEYPLVKNINSRDNWFVIRRVTIHTNFL